jgi:hypothetical protein
MLLMLSRSTYEIKLEQIAIQSVDVQDNIIQRIKPCSGVYNLIDEHLRSSRISNREASFSEAHGNLNV